MLKKRVMFSLIYDNGKFNQSRNFKLQKVGDANWLIKNYKFHESAQHIDELLILDASRGPRDSDAFLGTVQRITANVFAPVALGGGIRTLEDAAKYFSSGADKIILNTGYYVNSDLISDISDVYGRQSIVLQLDYLIDKEGELMTFSENGTKKERSVISILEDHPKVGEIIFHSIDQDGTARGFESKICDIIENFHYCPIVLSGGGGKSEHFEAILRLPFVDAACTANLLNFVGPGLKNLRNGLLERKIELPVWDFKNV